jgi:hypothetical protein
LTQVGLPGLWGILLTSTPSLTKLRLCCMSLRRTRLALFISPPPSRSQMAPSLESLVTCSARNAPPPSSKLMVTRLARATQFKNMRKFPLSIGLKSPSKLISSRELTMKIIHMRLPCGLPPNLSPLPFGAKIEQTLFDDALIEEMGTISKYHGMWAKLMAEVINQAVTKESNVPTIAKRLINSSGTRIRNPCRVASKGFRSATIPTSAPFVKISSLGKNSPNNKPSFILILSTTPHQFVRNNPPLMPCKKS